MYFDMDSWLIQTTTGALKKSLIAGKNWLLVSMSKHVEGLTYVSLARLREHRGPDSYREGTRHDSLPNFQFFPVAAP
ncbi:MAG: hypothetical protein K0S33_2113 [Bacteroidetes bacterium]|jgi:hypothetical protein|nr:hypothetical protein [Bacteroidota bacterium]